MILNDDCKRLIIYFIYDKQGIVDDYICYMLDALKKNSSEIAIVCNGLLTDGSRQRLEPYADKLIVRDNKGFDVWAYKTVLDDYGWNKLSEYDEVIMMNFTIMGPVYPLEEMFSEMNKRDLDFWGVSMFHEYKEGDPFGTIEIGYVPDHIQSHFIAVRNDMLCSDEFKTYWKNMQPIRDYRDAVGCHEAMFTRRFSEKGFKWDVYADMGSTYNDHPILLATKEMFIEHRCPFFKRRSFMQNYDNILSDTMGQNAVETYEFLKNETDYDVDMIWQNILRLENQADIKKNMQLNYVLSEKSEEDISNVLKSKKIALVMHLYFEDLIDYCLSYAKSMPDVADIYLTVGSENLAEVAKEKFDTLPNKVEIIMIENRGRDVSALLVGTKDFIMDYDYVCFMHDKKVMQLKPETIGVSFSYKCFENMLASKGFVDNIINVFEENPRLGILMPPPPNHGDYFITIGLEWGKNYKITKKLADELGLTVPITKDKEPIAPLGTMFWFRPKAMKLLFDKDWQYEDFPKEPNKIDGTLLHAVERIYSYVVQQEGYYPAWVMSEKLASMEITNLYHMLRSQNDIIFNVGPGADKSEKVNKELRIALKEWRNAETTFIRKDRLERARIYFKGVNENYSELNSLREDNALEGTEDGIEIRYNDLERYGVVEEIRFDPGEVSATIEDIAVFVYDLDGKREEYNIGDVHGDWIDFEDHKTFIYPDPQIFLALREPKKLKKIVVKGKIFEGTDLHDVNQIYKTVAGRSKLDKIKSLFK